MARSCVIGSPSFRKSMTWRYKKILGLWLNIVFYANPSPPSPFWSLKTYIIFQESHSFVRNSFVILIFTRFDLFQLDVSTTFKMQLQKCMMHGQLSNSLTKNGGRLYFNIHVLHVKIDHKKETKSDLKKGCNLKKKHISFQYNSTVLCNFI